MEDIIPLKIWCINSGLNKLCDFSSWVENGKRIKWKRISPPTDFFPFLSKIYNLLVGFAPIEVGVKDS